MPPGVNRNTQAQALHQRHWLLTAGTPKTSERSRQASATWRTNVPTRYAHTKWPRKPSKSPVTVLPSLPTRCQHQGHRRQNPLLDKLTATPWASATNRPCLRAQGNSREACTPRPRVRAQHVVYGRSHLRWAEDGPAQPPASGPQRTGPQPLTSRGTALIPSVTEGETPSFTWVSDVTHPSGRGQHDKDTRLCEHLCAAGAGTAGGLGHTT